jgi:hypothetical protein
MSWMKILTFLSADDLPNENMILLPADDFLMKIGMVTGKRRGGSPVS